MIRRIFTETVLQPGDRLTVTGEDGHHLVRVLRVRIGEQLTAAGPNGVFAAAVEEIGKAEAVLAIGDRQPEQEPKTAVYVIQALAKGDKIETVIQKCTEIGAAGIVIVQTERSVVQLAAAKVPERVERWRKVAREAASQSQRDRVPDIHFCADTTAVADWLHAHPDTSVLLLDEQERAIGLKRVLQSAKRTSYALLVGPEGGWSEEERRHWQSLGASAVSLGPRILRTETAGLVGVSAILYEHNELGG